MDEFVVLFLVIGAFLGGILVVLGSEHFFSTKDEAPKRSTLQAKVLHEMEPGRYLVHALFYEHDPALPMEQDVHLRGKIRAMLLTSSNSEGYLCSFDYDEYDDWHQLVTHRYILIEVRGQAKRIRRAD